MSLARSGDPVYWTLVQLREKRAMVRFCKSRRCDRLKAELPEILETQLVPATTSVASDTHDGHDGYKHYGEDYRCHDASVWDTPHPEHSNVKSSGNPPNRAVRRISRIGCAHFGQRGG
jgi:hypothetical protein